MVKQERQMGDENEDAPEAGLEEEEEATAGLKSQLEALEAQRDQLAALLVDGDGDASSSLVTLQGELAVAIDGIRQRLKQAAPLKVEDDDIVVIGVGDVCLAPRIFDRRRAQAVVEQVDSSKGTCLVTWVHPRQRGELPCRYWKEGSCKFSGQNCSFSHGIEVSMSDLLPVKSKGKTDELNGTVGQDATDTLDPAEWLASVGKGSRLLARYEDRIWYEATADGPVTAATVDIKTLAVLFDGFEEEGAVPIPANTSNLAPLDDSVGYSHGDTRESGRGGGEEAIGDGGEDSSDLEDAWAETPDLVPEESLFRERVLGDHPVGNSRSRVGGVGGESEREELYIVGDWEQHTKGFGSRMMSKMGYRRGEGLGKEKQGIARPVAIRVLPERCALDHLRGGDGGHPPPGFGIRKKKTKKPGASSARSTDQPQSAVFDFLNVAIHVSAKGVRRGAMGSGSFGSGLEASFSSQNNEFLSKPFAHRRRVFRAQSRAISSSSSPSAAQPFAGRIDENKNGNSGASSRAVDMTKAQLRAHLVGAREVETKLMAKIARLEETVTRNAERDPRTAAQARIKLQEVMAQAREVKSSRSTAERVLGDRADRGKGGGKGGLFSF